MHLAPVSQDHWLENPKRKTRSGKRRRKAGRRRFTLTRQSKGGTVAKRRRRRRRAITRPVRRRRRRPVAVAVATNRPRRRRRHHRRLPAPVYNPRRRRRRRRFSLLGNRRNPGFSIKSVLNEARQAGTLALQITAGKALTRAVRARVTSERGTKKQVAYELGIATLLGYAASMTLGARVGCNIMAGGYAAALEALIHQLQVPVLSDAIADDGNPQVIAVPPSVAPAVAGYVREQMNGYVSGYVPSRLGDSATTPGVSELSFIDS